MQNTKSATTAGLLGIFLGSIGGHNWYLGDKKKGIIHVSMVGAGIVLEIIAGVIVANASSSLSGAMSFMTGGFAWTGILSGLGAAIIGASGIWGFIEGVIILSQGDAGLAQKGYAVANPQAGYYNQGYTGQGYQNYGQGYQQGYGQPMNNGYPAQNPAQNAPQGQFQAEQPYNPDMTQNGYQGPQNAPQGQTPENWGQNGQ